MSARPWLLASVGLNLFLAVSWWVAREPLEDSTVVIPTYRTEFAVQTNTVVRRENFTWDQVQSTNLSVFITKLRGIGCPEQTIRDLVIAQIDRVFDRRRATEIVAPDYQWWKSEPDPAIVRTAAAQAQALDDERARLLTSLLGPAWQSDSLAAIASRAGVSLTGPVLGGLSDEVKQDVLLAVARGQNKIEAYLQAQREANLPPDPMQMAELRQNFLGQIVGVLLPDQYEEFALRYSQAAQTLRQQMRGMDLSPDQFRALFNAVGSALSQPVFYYNGTDPQLLAQQKALQDQDQAAVKTALGNDFYNSYTLAQDPVYQSSLNVVAQVGAPASDITPLYEISRATQSELDRIRSDPDLTDDEKVEALAQAQVEQQQSIRQLLGPDLFAKWLQASR